MKVFSCIAILVSVLSLVSCCCIPLKSTSWDCKTHKMDELMSKMDYLIEKKLEMKSKLEMYKQMKNVFGYGYCGKMPSNCELVFGTPIEQCRTKEMAACNYYPQPQYQCGGCCRY